MSVTKNYFVYHMKRILLLIGGGGILSILFMMSAFMLTRYDYRYERIATYSVAEPGTIMMIVMCLACFLPILQFYEFKNRRNLDTWFSLPLSRRKIALIHYAGGAVLITAISLICTVTGTIMMADQGLKHYSVGNLWLFFLLSTLFALAVYTFMTFVFIEANNVFDGASMEMMWLFLPICAVYLVILIIGAITMDDVFDDSFGFRLAEMITSPMIFSEYLSDVFGDMINTGYHGESYYAPLASSDADPSVYITVVLIVWGVIAAASVFLLTRSFAKKKTELVGGVTDSVIGYRFWLPVASVLMILLTGDNSIIRLFMMGMIFFAYLVYRRGIKTFKKADIIFLSVATFIAILPIDYIRVLRGFFG